MLPAANPHCRPSGAGPLKLPLARSDGDEMKFPVHVLQLRLYTLRKRAESPGAFPLFDHNDVVYDGSERPLREASESTVNAASFLVELL